MISSSNEQLQQELKCTLLKPDCHCWWISKMQSGREDTLEERYAIRLRFKHGKNATETYGMLQTAFRPSCMNRASVFEWYKRFKEVRDLWGMMMRGVRGVRKSIHQSWLAKRLGLLCWGFKGVQEEIPSEQGQHSSNRVSGISTRTMHQSTTPSLSQTIWPRWASRQFLTLPIVQNLLPVTFRYSLSSEAVVMRQLRRWTRLWRRSLTRSHTLSLSSIFLFPSNTFYLYLSPSPTLSPTFITWTLTKRMEKKLDGNYTRMLRAVLNKSWRQHPTKQLLHDYLPPIRKTIQVRRSRHAGHC